MKKGIMLSWGNIRGRENVDEINDSGSYFAGIKARDDEPQVAEQQVHDTEGKMNKGRVKASISQDRHRRQ